MISDKDHGPDQPVGRLSHGAAALLLFVIAGVLAFPAWLWWSASRTSAAFSDAEVLENNHLGAATLDIEVGDRTAALRAENMAPGDAMSGQLALTNAGTLPLRYEIQAATDGGPLTDWLVFDLWATTEVCRPDEAGPLLATEVSLSRSPTVLVGPTGGTASAVPSSELALAPGAGATFCLRAQLPLDAPNEVQGQRLDLELLVLAYHDLEAEQ